MKNYDCSCNNKGPGIIAGPIIKLCDKQEKVVSLATVVISAQLGDDTGAYKPEFGAFTNTVVWYEANDAVYIYDAEGQYTLFAKRGEIAEGSTGYVIGDDIYAMKRAIDAALEELSNRLATETEERIAADEKLTQDLEAETEAREAADAKLTEDLEAETQAREQADQEINDRITDIQNSPDVRFIVDTHADLEEIDKSGVSDKDYARVLQDETHDGASTYYQFDLSSQEWNYIGMTGPYYTKQEMDEKLDAKQDTLVGEGEGQNLKTVNGESLLGEGDIEIPTAVLYSEYGENEDGALTQKFVSNKLNADSVKFGNGAQQYQYSYSGSFNPANGVSIGKSAISYTYSIAIGSGAEAGNGPQSAGCSIAIGEKASTNGGRSTIAIGESAQARYDGAVAIGRSASASRANEVSIGSTSTTRYLANVTAGEKDTDAVNVKQLNDTIDAKLGDIDALLIALDTGAGVTA